MPVQVTKTYTDIQIGQALCDRFSSGYLREIGVALVEGRLTLVSPSSTRKRRATITEEQKNLVRQRKLEGKTHREIADEFGISPSQSVAICKTIRDKMNVVFRRPI